MRMAWWLLAVLGIKAGRERRSTLAGKRFALVISVFKTEVPECGRLQRKRRGAHVGDRILAEVDGDERRGL